MTGDPACVQRAKKMIEDLMSSQPGGGMGGPNPGPGTPHLTPTSPPSSLISVSAFSSSGGLQSTEVRALTLVCALICVGQNVEVIDIPNQCVGGVIGAQASPAQPEAHPPLHFSGAQDSIPSAARLRIYILLFAFRVGRSSTCRRLPAPTSRCKRTTKSYP